jgi:hypothetical protein
MLKAALVLCGFDPTRFEGHGLRIGMASQAAMDGKSDSYIRFAGRCASDAIRKYIRVA